MTTQERVVQDTGAKITDEGIARMRARIGVCVPRREPWIRIASTDGFRHFAHGIGDDNPLWCDPKHGPRTRWGDNIAPPTFLTNMGENEPDVTEPSAELRERGRGALAGVHSFHAGDGWEWFRPVYPGDRITARHFLFEVIEKKSRFGLRSVITADRTVYRNQHREVVAFMTHSSVHTERETAAKTGKYSDIHRPHYTEEMLKEIHDAYEAERVRGAETRYWEDVREGEELQTIAKGPLLITDIIAWFQGWASPFARAFKMRYQYMKRHPRALTMNEYGVPDVIERVHWEDEWAQKIGNPYAYDYGRQRNAMMTNVITNWMGDDAWLWKLDDQVRLFNYVGDTQWVSGKVTRKYKLDERYCVDLDIACTNQRGGVTSPGHATVILPSREGGAMVLPKQPTEKEIMPPPMVDV